MALVSSAILDEFYAALSLPGGFSCLVSPHSFYDLLVHRTRPRGSGLASITLHDLAKPYSFAWSIVA